MTRSFTKFTDEQLARALHFIEGHEDCLEGSELKSWLRIKEMICNTAEQIGEEA